MKKIECEGLASQLPRANTRKRPTGRGGAPWALDRVGVVAALALIGVRLLTLWLARSLVKSDPLRRVDAIAVLGGGAYDETTQRLVGVWAALRGPAPPEGHASVLILTGGESPLGRSG